jgi:hypothetical protein
MNKELKDLLWIIIAWLGFIAGELFFLAIKK